jgi:chromosome segregation protein
VIGYGNTLVKTEPEFQRLADFLLGRTLVVDTIDHAIAIARKYRQSVRMVTLEGEVMNVGGAMSGGAFRNAGNLLGRRREMDELGKKTEQIAERVNQIRSEIEGFRKKSDKNTEEYEQIDRLLQELSLQKNTLTLQKEQLLNRKKELNNTFQGKKEEEEALLVQSKGLREAIENVKEEIAESERKTQELQKEIEAVGEELSRGKASLKEISSEAEKFRMENASVLQKLAFEKEHLVRLEKEAKDKDGETERLEKESSHLEQEKQELLKRIQEEQALAVQKEEKIADGEKKSEELLLCQKETQETLKAVIGRREDLQRQLSGLDKECFRLNGQKETNEAKLEEMSDYMWKEYEISYHNLLETAEKPTEPLSELRNRVQDLKEKKKALGDVNVNAIEDYRQVSERYLLMKGQHDDVVAAEETLRKIIDDLDRQMREQFEEKFHEIQAQFDLVFKELFGGGQGTLELTDDEDVLLAGIRINAQPPGKKLQNMMQLSGGEKSLTAIALLFAIQNLKPSPFCLLDEIEAALDDANVKRYAKYLHKLTKETQFLVITHRRGTMTAADVLYGITMQEKGVSALVSVSLVEGELT